MFNDKHYVPILRWKAAEKDALRDVPAKDKDAISPLLELIMPQPKKTSIRNGNTPAQMLEESVSLLSTKAVEIPAEILEYWGKKPIFIDVHLIDATVRAACLEQILLGAKVLGIFVIPVISMTSTTSVESDAKAKEFALDFAEKHNHGICLRLSRSDLRRESVADEINAFLKFHGLKKADTDLLIDLQIADDEYKSLVPRINALPGLSEWRTFTLISGAFPVDLTKFKQPDLYRIERMDWKAWLDSNSSLSRKAAFGDYTIQHPVYREPVPGANPSASIRYTAREEWLVMKGQGLRSPKSAGHAQYPANAALLIGQPEFKSFGETFSVGDAYIAKMGKEPTKAKQTGNPRTWLRAGINHHLVCVVWQLSNLND